MCFLGSCFTLLINDLPIVRVLPLDFFLKKRRKKELDEHKTSYLLRNTDFGTGNEKQQESIKFQGDKDMV